MCEASLNNCAIKLNLGELIFLGRGGEEANGGRERGVNICPTPWKLLSEAFIWTGGHGSSGRRESSGKSLPRHMKKAVKGLLFMDYKTALQEELQKSGDVRIQYKLIEANGPDHSKTF